MNVDLDKMPLTELKALAYDQFVLLEQTQANLRIINQKIAMLQEQEVKNKKLE